MSHSSLARLPKSVQKFFFLGCLLLGILSPPLAAQNNDSGLNQKAQEEFSKRQYGKALELYRRYLRARPNDHDAWTRFAITYYHTGQAEQALKYLRHSRVSPALKPLNLYYRALCYDALGEAARASKLLARVSRMDDDIAEDALFERAAIEFQEGDSGAAKVSAEDYRRRYRNGRYRAANDSMLARMGQAGKVSVEESQRSRYRRSFFTYHPLSLMAMPHSWVYQLGYEWITGQRVNPTSNPDQSADTKTYAQQKLLAKAGVFVGPYQYGQTSSLFGYLYAQEWGSDSDRLKVYSEDIFDFQYFPFRPDLMQRSHRLYLATTGSIRNFTYGFYSHLEYRRGGSSFVPAPERKEIRKSFDIGRSTTVIPWLEWNYLPQHKLRASLFFDKFLDAADGDYSFKTYNIANGKDAPFFSTSLQQISYWPAYNMNSTFEFFRWVYLYNDYWEGYDATGGSAALDFLSLPNIPFPLAIGGRFTLAQRTYTSSLIKSGPCDGSPGLPSTCPRVDTYLKYGAYLSYISDKQKAFTVALDYNQLENPTLKVYNESAFNILFEVTQAFPDLDTGAKYLEPPRGLYLSRRAY